ncbi:chaperone protein [Grosmannia clavigera kw1407]|uniref:Chaperone protein n=1 Tax=Grosmannia clavigera (strain kw1407 / UAMH 11150) TaxID=655863 RepID=F0XP64_GROCL|nr:chaperone protein [Grosmannia clavigera kw1407]EFX00696.1 chaperone protein [Grosmannia clavigera kw1407]
MSFNNEQTFSLPRVNRIPQRIYTGCTGEQARSTTNGSRALRRACPRIADETASTWTRVLRPSLQLFSVIFALVFIIGGLFLVLWALFASSASTSAHTNTNTPESAGLLVPTASMSPYEKLGLPQLENFGSNAHITDTEIRAAYRKAVRHFHPDKVKAKTSEQLLAAEEHVRLINEAYEELTDPYRRCLLDQVWGCWRHLEKQLEEEMRQREEEQMEELRAEAAQMHMHQDDADDGQTENQADDPFGLVVVMFAQVAAYRAARSILSLLEELDGLTGGFGKYVLRGISYLAGRLQSRIRIV